MLANIDTNQEIDHKFCHGFKLCRMYVKMLEVHTYVQCFNRIWDGKSFLKKLN